MHARRSSRTDAVTAAEPPAVPTLARSGPGPLPESAPRPLPASDQRPLSLRRQLRTGSVALVLFTLLTGVLYPAVVTVVAQVAFRDQANGSLIVIDGRVAGSRLIGQAFTAPGYFWSRPSATSPYAYHAAASAGSNLGPSSATLARDVAARVDRLHAADPSAAGPVPIDLVTASGSGLDPHISVAAAEYQVERVARARGRSAAEVRRLVSRSTEGRQLGILGEPRVHVLALNLALDGLQ